MKRFKELMRKLWAGLNGNKTLLGTTLMTILAYAPLPQPWQGIAIAIVSLWTGVSFVHHVKKGYLTTQKDN